MHFGVFSPTTTESFTRPTFTQDGHSSRIRSDYRNSLTRRTDCDPRSLLPWRVMVPLHKLQREISPLEQLSIPSNSTHSAQLFRQLPIQPRAILSSPVSSARKFLDQISPCRATTKTTNGPLHQTPTPMKTHRRSICRTLPAQVSSHLQPSTV
jgi:hypothetical protein